MGESLLSIPELDFSDPIFGGLSVRFQQYSPFIWIWKFQKNELSIYLERNPQIRNILKEQCYQIRKKILADILSVKDSEIIIQLDDHGKPSLKGPVTNLSFSTSYTRSCWVFAVSSRGTIGIDIEDIQGNLDILKVAQRFFSPLEYDYLSHLPVEKKITTFFQFWTVKEAYLKATGTGLVGLQDLPDLYEHIRRYQEKDHIPFILEYGFMADICECGDVCMSIVFRQKEDTRFGIIGI